MLELEALEYEKEKLKMSKRDKTNVLSIVNKSHVLIPAGGSHVKGDLALPKVSTALVVFIHGNGSSRLSPRNQFVARTLFESGFATLLVDLLTPEEDQLERKTGEIRFDSEMLGDRVVEIIDWLSVSPNTEGLKIGLFGASTGAAAAVLAATRRDKWVNAVVSRGGRPDLALEALPTLSSPTLLIVGGQDQQVAELNQQALALITCTKALATVAGATHLFEEPGAIEEVAALSKAWFSKYLK